jgi:hypothetical protein
MFFSLPPPVEVYKYTVFFLLLFRYLQLLGLVPTDPGVLQKMAEIYDNEGDKQQAYQYHSDVCFFRKFRTDSFNITICIAVCFPLSSSYTSFCLHVLYLKLLN